MASLFLLLLRSDSAGAAVAAGLFLVSSFLVFLPDIEVLKGFGVEAKLRARLNEAEEILKKLRKLAFVNGMMAYQHLGWGNRMGGASSREKQILSDEVDSVLLDLGSDPREIAKIKKDYLKFANFDLAQHFGYLAALRIEQHESEANAEANNCDDQNEKAALAAEADALRHLKHETHISLAHASEKTFTEHWEKILASTPRLRSDQTFRSYAQSVGRLMSQIEKEQRISSEAADLIDADSSDIRDKLYKEIFGKEASR